MTSDDIALSVAVSGTDALGARLSRSLLPVDRRYWSDLYLQRSDDGMKLLRKV